MTLFFLPSVVTWVIFSEAISYIKRLFSLAKPIFKPSGEKVGSCNWDAIFVNFLEAKL